MNFVLSRYFFFIKYDTNSACMIRAKSHTDCFHRLWTCLWELQACLLNKRCLPGI